ncbi:MAG: hypothetical protein ABWY51_09555 [Gaiellaceae bacterium]
MRRKKRFSIGWVALGLAVVAIVPVTAQAKPLPSAPSHEQGMPVYVIGTLSPDDRAFSRVDSARQVEIPYLSHGVGVTTAELGIATGSPDDRGFARTQPEAVTIVATDDGSRYDLNPYVVSGFGLALLLLAGGMGIAIRHSRKTTLSPA